ncbi:hypothetical protein [Halorubrum lacusprofundi]|nr:hypothetical protein [Halorubrum lacusprofundi]MCG1007626.1 hypothetical protein [Halorubrum lacusprofundi]
MVERLTEDEWDRIEAFAKTPAYARQPELLLPEDAHIDDEIDNKVDDEDATERARPASPVPGER